MYRSWRWNKIISLCGTCWFGGGRKYVWYLIRPPRHIDGLQQRTSVEVGTETYLTWSTTYFGVGCFASKSPKLDFNWFSSRMEFHMLPIESKFHDNFVFSIPFSLRFHQIIACQFFLSYYILIYKKKLYIILQNIKILILIYELIKSFIINKIQQ